MADASISTGIQGLDDVLGGGLTADRIYLVEGDPGAGKTTLALQFLLDGRARGERGLYVTLSESKHELTAIAASHGWSLDGVQIVELVAGDELLDPDSQYSMFHPSEAELSKTTRTILEQVEATKPARIVFDSLSEMRLLAQSPLRYRRQILALKQFFVGRSATVLLLDDRTAEGSDLQLQSIAHGVITLSHLAPEFGAERRRLRVMKFRGRRFRGGYHDFRIAHGGIQVFPRLVASEHHAEFTRGIVASGVQAIDDLLGGGIDSGTSTLIMGPAGCGKSSLAAQYVVEAARRGDKSVLFTFDESLATLLHRTEGMGIPLEKHVRSGLVHVMQVDPAELSPGEFAAYIRRAVEVDHARILVIDSLNGYLNAMPEERFLTIQLHEVLTYLGQQGVTTLLLMAQHGLVGKDMLSPVDTSYLADSVVLLRYFEAGGAVRQAISVVKKRTGRHERTIREFKIEHGGIVVGQPLVNFSGVLGGVPQFSGNNAALLNSGADPAGGPP